MVPIPPSGSHATSYLPNERKLSRSFVTATTVYISFQGLPPLTTPFKCSRYVSLKFVVAALTGKSNEIKIYRHLASQSGPPHPGSKYILTPLDEFRVRGVNGEHDVLVLPVLGPHLEDMLDENPHLIPRKSLMRQIVLGVSFLHDCGVVHGG